MMANCSDNVYVIKYTDKAKGTITITKSSLVTNLVDIALVGKSRLNYGEVYNENMLHLLENFSCPASSDNVDVPDQSIAFGSLLQHPVQGQKWHNSTNNRLYVYSEGTWIPQGKTADVAGNSGIIAHGSFLPRPVAADGYVFTYPECNFMVSQHSGKSVASDTYLPTNTEIDYMKCFVSSNGQVTMQFRYRGEAALREGYANYAIIGIRGETNTPLISVTPYPVPSPTPGVSATPPASPTPTPTKTPAVSAAASQTPTPTPGSSATRTPTPTPTITTTQTPTPTPSTTPPITPTMTPTLSQTNAVFIDQAFSNAMHPAGYVGTATAGYALYNNGQAWTQSSSNGGHQITGQWLVSGSASAFQALATYVDESGAQYTMGGNALNTWISLGTGANWTISVSTQGMGNNYESTASAYGTLTVQIRRVSDQVVVATANVNLSVQIGQPL